MHSKRFLLALTTLLTIWVYTSIADPPVIRIEPESLDFGDVPVNDTDTLLITIYNDGEDDLTVSNIHTEDEGFAVDWENIRQFDWEMDWEMLDRNRLMSIFVLNATIDDEQLVEGDYIGVFINGNICCGFAQVSDDGFPVGVTVWEDAFDDFGWPEILYFRFWITDEGYEYEAEPPDREYHFIHNGFITIRLEAERRLNPDDVAEEVIAPGESIEVEVYFSPQEAIEYIGTLTIESNDPENGEVEVPLTGWGDAGYHWRAPVITDNNHSIMVSRAAYDDEPLSVDDEIGVFTQADLLAGWTIWPEDGRIGFPAWGDESETEDIVEGFAEDEPFSFRVWDHIGEMEWEAIADFTEGPDSYVINGMSVVELQVIRYRDLVVEMNQGWNMISINVDPHEYYTDDEERGPDVIMMFEQVRINENQHRIELLKDEGGFFWAPGWRFINIDYWNLKRGYKVRISEDAAAEFTGRSIPPDTDIALRENWNIIAYLPTYELSCAAPEFVVLEPILEHVIIAKNAQGRFAVPEFRYSNMPPWRETQGYQIKVDEDVVFNYPPEPEEFVIASATKQSLASAGKRLFRNAHNDKLHHWTSPTSTGDNMSLLITSLSGGSINNGDQIAAFTDTDHIIGVGTVENGCCGIAVWGDDESTETIECLVEGEAFKLKLWNSENNIEYDLQVEAIHAGKGLIYATDAFTAIGVSVPPVVPDDYYLSGAYPNPFNNLTRIEFGTPEASRLTINVYDLSGRLVSRLIDERLTAGHHTALWNASSATAGVYLVRLETNGFSAVRKVILVK